MKRIKGEKMLTDNKFLNMYELDAVKLNGDTFKYYFATRGRGDELKIHTHKNNPEGVVVYALAGDKLDKIVLVKQFRFPINDYIYEMPAGLVEKGEDPQMTGVREFEEETGMKLELYTGGNKVWRTPFYTTVGLTDESVEPVYGYAKGVPNRDKMEDTEDIETILADRNEVRRILREEKVAMKCALLLMQFLAADDAEPFKFLEL